MKKVVALLLVAVMALSVLAGCDKKEDTPATGTTTNAPASNSNDSSTPVKISLYRASFNTQTPDSTQEKKIQDKLNAYLKEKGFNIEIDYHDIGSDEYTDKANLALANNEINLLWTASWESVIGTNDLVPKNACYDLTDLLKGSTLYSSMDAGQWEATKYNGKNYFVPVYKDNVEGYDIMFRQDLIDQFGWNISSVKSLADIEPMLADAKNAGLKYPLLLQKTAMFYRFYIDKFDFFTADVTGNFVSVDKAKNEVINTIQTPEYKEYCNLIAKWAEAGYISEDEVTKSVSDTTTQTKDWAVSWWTDVPVNDEADGRYNQDVTMQSITDRWAHSTSALGSCYCVTANSSAEQAKACVDFLGLLYTDSTFADIYTFGIEGEDFNYVTSEGGVKKVQQHSDKYNHSMWESASATVVTPIDNEPDNKADLYKTFNGGAKTSPAAGFRFDKTPVEAQYTACQSIFDQYGFILETGGVAVADVDSTIAAYQAELDAAGYQDVLAEFQKQYNAWKG
ncbi:MAG: ABC transporter substrate-binding protein [Lachnospiraceae bacterium]|nr:ABC transporter substrate-binding protein [Lachnospiraceae bacterium]MBR5177436.1 ABC transporter substrate-binding protein [Lachnospiraceae bacterium]